MIKFFISVWQFPCGLEQEVITALSDSGFYYLRDVGGGKFTRNPPPWPHLFMQIARPIHHFPRRSISILNGLTRWRRIDHLRLTLICCGVVEVQRKSFCPSVVPCFCWRSLQPVNSIPGPGSGKRQSRSGLLALKLPTDDSLL